MDYNIKKNLTDSSSAGEQLNDSEKKMKIRWKIKKLYLFYKNIETF